MVTSKGDGQSMDATAGGAAWAAFDFDGTLTIRDCFMAFLRWRSSPSAYALGLLRLAPASARYPLDRDKGRLKAAAVRIFLCGLPREALEAEARAFAAEMAPAWFRPDALEVWRRHGEDGDRRMIVSASPETLVAPFAEMLGCDRLIATRLRFDARDRVAGGFEGANCRGPEKVRRIREVFGPDVRLAAAYGDTDGDREMLTLADHPHMKVFKAKPGGADERHRPS